MRKIELSNQAQKRLQEITNYYPLNESIERTLKVLDFFDKSLPAISNNPFAYKKFRSARFINLDIRVYTHFKTYHIYFVVYFDTIKIAEVFHLKQDTEKRRLDL